MPATRLRAALKLKLADAVQAASTLAIGADTLVTHDHDFSAVRDLRVLGARERGRNPRRSLSAASRTGEGLETLPSGVSAYSAQFPWRFRQTPQFSLQNNN